MASPASDDLIIGIDLGTTNSCAAVVKDGRPFVIPSREGHNTVPSIVAINHRNRLIVGHPAKAQMLTNPRQTVYGGKRLVGRPFQSPIVQEIQHRFHYPVVEGEGGVAAVQLGDTVYTLQQLSALILKEVKEVAQSYLRREVTRAVITCPAYYNDNQRQAVREAGELAGLKVERVLNEPTAAALTYAWGKNLKQKVLVYDLGGGTFDTTLLDVKGNELEVLATGGDTFLGGVDFDTQLVDHLLHAFEQQTGRPFEGDRVALQRIHDAAERAKCELSEKSNCRVHVPFVALVGDQPIDLDVTVSREEFHAMTSGLVERTMASTQEVLDTVSVKPGQVDEVILVGGQSRMPLVRDRIVQLFGRTPHKGVHPDEAVALGAAILAHSLTGDRGVKLRDVLPMSIGLALPGGRFKPVIPRNTPLPHTKSYKLVTTRDNQTEFELVVYQGDSELAARNEYLGTVKLTGLPKRPKRTVEVVVSFSVNDESNFTVSARELSTRRSVTTQFATRRASATATPDDHEVEMSGPQGGAPAPRAAPLPPPITTRSPGTGIWARLMSMFGKNG